MLAAIKRRRFGLLKGQNTGENEVELGTDENLINERRNQFELTKQKLRSRGAEDVSILDHCCFSAKKV
jgi:hypothetical protein